MGKALTVLRPAKGLRGVAYLSIFLVSCLCIVMGAFLGERIALLSEHPTTFMNTAEFYVTFAATLASLVALFVLLRRNFRLPISWGWVFFFLILAVGNAIGTFAFGTHFAGSIIYRGKPYDYDWTFTVEDRVQYVLGFCVACVYFYLFFAVLPKVLPHSRWIRLCGYIPVLVALAAIVYSLIVEQDLYRLLFDPNGRIPAAWLVSFTNNENTFAFLILLAVMMLCMIHNANNRFYYWILILGFGIFQILTVSATSIVCTWLLIIVYVIYRFAISVRRHPFWSIVTLLLFFGGIIAVIVMTFTDAFGEGSLFAKLHREITSYSSGSRTSFQTRVATWNIIIQTVSANPLSLFFGIGEFQSRVYLALLHVPTLDGLHSYPAHNGIMQCFLDGGIVKLALCLLLIARFFYLVAKCAGLKQRLVWPILFVFLTMMIHGFMETTGFLFADTKSFTILFFCFLPLEISAFQGKHPSLVAYLKDYREQKESPKTVYEVSPVRMAKIASLVLTPICVIGVGVGLLLSQRGYAFFDWSYFALWGVAFFLIPFGCYCLGFKKGRKTGIGLFVGGVIAILVYGFYLMQTDIMATRIAFFGSLAVCLVPALFHLKSVFVSLGKLILGELPFLLLGASFLGCFLLSLCVPAEQFSIQILASFGITILFLYPVFITWLGRFRLGYPLDQMWHRFDARRTSLSLKREEKLLKKQQWKRKPKKVEKEPLPKRIYTYRPW